MPTPAEKKAQNEAAFRDSNEKIGRHAQVLVSDEGARIPFLCECTRRECTQVVRLTLAEYGDVRAKGDQGLVLPGHEDSSVERVIARQEGYFVTQKMGRAAEVAREMDPRS